MVRRLLAVIVTMVTAIVVRRLVAVRVTVVTVVGALVPWWRLAPRLVVRTMASRARAPETNMKGFMVAMVTK
jgi:hypothetical protein